MSAFLCAVLGDTLTLRKLYLCCDKMFKAKGQKAESTACSAFEQTQKKLSTLGVKS
jgi:hypothetical protein